VAEVENLNKKIDKEVKLEELSLLEKIQNNEKTETAILKAVDGSDSKGAAYKLFEEKKLNHVVLADLPDLKKGISYEGWLVQPKPLKFFSTGVMQKSKDGKWILEFKADEKYTDYFRVVITKEKIIDEKPENHIIEGDF